MTVKYSGEGIRDNTDETKVMGFDVSGVTTSTTRTLTMPDKDITLIGEDSSGKVGIGMTPTQKLEVNGGIALPTTQLLRWNNSGTIAGAIGVDNSNNMILYNTEYNTERMRILSSGGITFNGDTATANALDDYEEGTFTPTIVQGATMTNVSYAKYTKIGRVVHWAFYISITNTGNSSTLVVGGLPYSTSGSNTYTMQSNINSSSNNPTMNNPHFRIHPNSNLMYAIQNNDSGIPGQDIDGSHIIASGTYMTST